MSGNNVPWDFDEARRRAANASRNQTAQEENIKVAYRDWALKEEAYRVALAKRILELIAEGQAKTTAATIARGEPLVARLKAQCLIAEGVVEASKQAGWKVSKDRDDTQRFIDWSMRREMAEAT